MKWRVLAVLAASAVAGVGIAAAAESETRESVPLPAGGNFNGIRWPADEALDESLVDATVAYNAACQWLRAWRDGRDERPLEVFAEVAGSPVLEAMGSAPVLARVAEEAAAGGGETLSGVLRACDASHAREVAYAIQRGLPPSS